MKRILLFALLLCGLSAFAQEPVYVYLNNGTFHAFLSTQVDSMVVVGNKDSNRSEDLVQQIWTQDSVYSYPVQLIDSISFVTPATEFKKDAINLAEHLLDYVITADTTHVFLMPTIPTNLIPDVGQKIGYPTMDEVFPYGFAGKVKSVDQDESFVTLNCTPINLDEVFDTFYCVVTSEGYDERQSGRRAPSNAPIREGNIVRRHFNLPSYTFSLTEGLSKGLSKSGDLALSGDLESSVTLYNEFDVTVFYVVNRDMGYNVQMGVTGKHDIETKTSVYGTVNYKHSTPIRQLGIKEPLGYGFFFYANPGTFVDVSAQITNSGSMTTHFRSVGCYEYSSIGQSVLKPAFVMRPDGAEYNMQTSIDGRFAVGGFLEFGFTFVDQLIDKVAFRAEAGCELTGSAVLLGSDVEKGKHDPCVYKKLQNAPITLGFFSSLDIAIGLAAWSAAFNLRRVPYAPLLTCEMVPTFSNISVKQESGSDSSYRVNCEIHGKCLNPIQIGYSAFDGISDEPIGGIWADAVKRDYDNSFPYTFQNLPDLKIVYPKVKLFGFEFIAEPSATPGLYICPDNNHPHAIDLGLPSGTKWCCKNDGATAPEDYGNYYSWFDAVQKYSVAETPWYIPSYKQQEELCKNCIWEWTTHNGVNGCKLTGRNGNSIFLPAAGEYNKMGYDCEGTYGYYWSSSIQDIHLDGIYTIYELTLCSSWIGYGLAPNVFRLTVRPVCN